MKITKLENFELKKRADNQRQQAKKTIDECVEKGAGIYEVEDNEKIFPSKQTMVDRLKMACRPYEYSSSKSKWMVEVVTRNKKAQILVVVKEKEQ